MFRLFRRWRASQAKPRCDSCPFWTRDTSIPLPIPIGACRGMPPQMCFVVPKPKNPHEPKDQPVGSWVGVLPHTTADSCCSLHPDWS